MSDEKEKDVPQVEEKHEGTTPVTADTTTTPPAPPTGSDDQLPH